MAKSKSGAKSASTPKVVVELPLTPGKAARQPAATQTQDPPSAAKILAAKTKATPASGRAKATRTLAKSQASKSNRRAASLSLTGQGLKRRAKSQKKRAGRATAPVKAAAATRKPKTLAASAVLEVAEVSAFNRDNLEACLQSGVAVVRGAELLHKQMVGFVQADWETGFAAAEGVMSAKSLGELMEIQSDYAYKCFDNLLAQSGKLTELSAEIAKDALAPVQARLG